MCLAPTSVGSAESSVAFGSRVGSSLNKGWWNCKKHTQTPIQEQWGASGGDRVQLAEFLWWIITKLPAFCCGKWVLSLRCAAEKLQPGKGRQKRLSSYRIKFRSLDLHPECCWKAPATGLAVVPVVLWDGSVHVLAGTYKESPAVLGAGTGSHPAPG